MKISEFDFNFNWFNWLILRTCHQKKPNTLEFKLKNLQQPLLSVPWSVRGALGGTGQFSGDVLMSDMQDILVRASLVQ